MLARDFDADAPNVAWVTDVTYIWTDEGWLYLAVMLDLFSRRVVGWAMSAHERPRAGPRALWIAPPTQRPPRRPRAPLRPRQPVRQRRLPRALLRPRRSSQHEPQGRLLGQRRRRELLRDAARASWSTTSATRRGPTRRVDRRLHRRLLQPPRRHSAIGYVSPIESS